MKSAYRFILALTLMGSMAPATTIDLTGTIGGLRTGAFDTVLSVGPPLDEAFDLGEVRSARTRSITFDPSPVAEASSFVFISAGICILALTGKRHGFI